MNAEKCRQFLIHHAIPSGKHLIGNGFIFQHDNDPKHTANPVKSYLERKTADKTLTVKHWPPQSPDLNIIEAVWDHLDRERNKREPKSKDELWEVLRELVFLSFSYHPGAFNLYSIPNSRKTIAIFVELCIF